MNQYSMSRNHNIRLLGDIAKIRSGYTFRGKIEEVGHEKGNAHIVQIKDSRKISDETQSTLITAEQLPYIQWDGKSSAFLDPNCVLLPARGGYFRASLVTSSGPGTLPVIASSQFLIIQPKPSVLPEFLCWSLNQSRTQYELSEASQGSNIPMLSAATIQQVKLTIPPIDIQNKVLHLNRLWEQEQKLTHALLNNREAQMQGVFQQLITEKIN